MFARRARTILGSPSPILCQARCSMSGWRPSLDGKRNWTDSDDLCIMFKASYHTDFYRAVRDALHAEVDSWPEEDAYEIDPDTEALWRRVSELEPVSQKLGRLYTSGWSQSWIRLRFVPRASVNSGHGGVDARASFDPWLFSFRGSEGTADHEAVCPAWDSLPCVRIFAKKASMSMSSTPLFPAAKNSSISCGAEKPSVLGIYTNLMTRGNVIEILVCARSRLEDGGGWSRAGRLRAGVFAGRRGLRRLRRRRNHDGGATAGPALRRAGLSKIAGLASLDENGELRQGAPRGQIANLDLQPWPARDAIDIRAICGNLANPSRHRLGELHYGPGLPLSLQLVQPPGFWPIAPAARPSAGSG